MPRRAQIDMKEGDTLELLLQNHEARLHKLQLPTSQPGTTAAVHLRLVVSESLIFWTKSVLPLFLFLIATNSYLLLLVRHLFLVAMHLLLVALWKCVTNIV